MPVALEEVRTTLPPSQNVVVVPAVIVGAAGIGLTVTVVAGDIALLLDQVNRRGFDLRFDGLAPFGGRKPRAVVAAVAPVPPLIELQAEHERLMQRVGLEPEKRKYTPHVTLARLRDSTSLQVADYLSARGPFRVAPFSVSRFVLYSSKTSVGGGPYVVEADYPLAG